ncbi:S8 family peptidase [Streptomyces sp. MA5143a]|uniref:S8 family peptidase n=1 Tax=Streptomyces sp. MA5143a TaxID=2083010 RepID=UPI000D1A026E|nr:Serine protease AprX [Streptomyces sp. MA5143a]
MTVAALAAGLTGTARATPVPTAVPAAAKSMDATGKHRITLVTGDRVIVDAKGRVVGMERAKGRERVPVQMRRVDGHTLVVPTDAAQMIASGRLDQRLFDITELDKAANRRSQRNGVKVIVGYTGTASTAKADVRDAGTLRHGFRTLNLDSVQTSAEETPDLWHALTHGNAVASGISHIWLDGVRKMSLDKSVPQIGAPAAWARGYDGKGVKVAVLDTGIDTSHPDLKDQVIAAKNFSTAATTRDHQGHGTHVASTIAGTGALSGGKYKGVAPGAKILNGKVLDDEGEGDDSGIIAGMEWAAEQGADIVNLSLGGGDTPGTDPMEATVNRLSEEKGILFAIAAGNEGEQGAKTVGSPGSAANALTVGAVDGTDRLADFSSRGPTADGAIKPDVTAPGVGITAASAKGSEIAKEYGENPAGYVSISGTSMATPHVAGAAALLKQQHPDWTFSELKAVLVGSAKGGAYTPNQQGSGRIQVDKAIDQSVVAKTTSVNFPVQQWPHTDDTPVTRKLTYRNLGTKDVTLTLSTTAYDPKGQAAPAGFFTTGADHVTVPAGGEASVDVTVNTKLGGDLDGGYSAYVSATGDGQTVRTAVGVERETEAYDLTLKFVNRPGQHPVHLTTLSVATRGSGGYANVSTEDTVTFRVPKDRYILDSLSMKDLDSTEGGADWLARPVLNLDRNTTITLDLNRTRPADITVPDAQAKPLQALVSYEYLPADVWFGVEMPSFSDIRLAHVGPAMDSGLVQTWSGQWTRGSDTEYDIVGGGETKKVLGDRVHHYKASELATVKAGLGASAPGKTGALGLTVHVPFGYGLHTPVPQKLPATRTLHLSTGEGAEYYFAFEQHSGRQDPDGVPLNDASADTSSYKKLTGGRTYQKRFNTAVFAPRAIRDEYQGLFHTSEGIYGDLSLFADGQGHHASSDLTSVRTTLYRNGGKFGSNTDPLTGKVTFRVPVGAADYTLTTSARRSAKVHAASTRVDASWTFHSKRPTSGVTELPVSSVRFKAPVGLDSRVPAGRTVTYPVTVEGAAAGRNLKSLTAYVSYDDGRTWTKTDVRNGKITVRNPAKGKGVSLRAKITDKKGNRSTISVHNAYYGK